MLTEAEKNSDKFLEKRRNQGKVVQLIDHLFIRCKHEEEKYKKGKKTQQATQKKTEEEETAEGEDGAKADQEAIEKKAEQAAKKKKAKASKQQSQKAKRELDDPEELIKMLKQIQEQLKIHHEILQALNKKTNEQRN